MFFTHIHGALDRLVSTAGAIISFSLTLSCNMPQHNVPATSASQNQRIPASAIFLISAYDGPGIRQVILPN